MEPGNTDVPAECRELSEILARIGDKWTVLIVTRLSTGPMRFNRLRRSIEGISQRMLTLTLRSLERDGLVRRTVYPTVPPQVEYRLTELGLTLIEPLRTLSDWARRNRPQIELARQRFDSRNGEARAGAR